MPVSERNTTAAVYNKILVLVWNSKYRVSIKSFPDYIYYKKTTVRRI